MLRIPLIGNLVSKIRRLIFLKPKISARNKDGETALICAVKKGNVRIVDILTKAVADRNEKKKALIFAAKKGDIEVVKTLMKAMKDNPEAKVISEEALVFVINEDNEKAIKTLIEADLGGKFIGAKALKFAAEKGYTLKIIMKEELEANVELQNIFNSYKKENRQADDGCTVESPPAFLAKSAVIQGNQQTTSAKTLQ